MNDILKQAGKEYAQHIMTKYTHPPDQATKELDRFMSYKLTSAEYDVVEHALACSQFLSKRQKKTTNRRQVRAIAHYAQDSARSLRDKYYCNLVMSGQL